VRDLAAHVGGTGWLSPRAARKESDERRSPPVEGVRWTELRTATGAVAELVRHGGSRGVGGDVARVVSTFG